MSQQMGRFASASPSTVAEGWSLERITPVSRLFGANGIRTGPDGRIYVAQVSGSQISAIDVATGAIEAISPMGGDIIAPDDLAFDDEGNIYATEITEGRVSMLAPNGATRVIHGDIPVANPITFHQGRLIAGELRIGGRIMELDRNGGAPRVILDNVPMVNAFDVGPDGMLYFPAQGANEIWRVSLDGGEPEVVAKDLGVPDSVKFHRDGSIISTQVVSGQVLKIDPRTGAQTVLADIGPGLDNSTFVGDRLFASSIPGQVNEILGDGTFKPLVPQGFNWPLGLAMDADGQLYIGDGPFMYVVRPGEEVRQAGMLFSPGFPGYARGLASSGPGEVIVATANGQVSRYWPARMESEILAEGFDRLYGVALGSDGTVFVAEAGAGRVLAIRSGNVEELARDLNEPMGVAIAPDGSCLIAESGAGRVVKVSGGRAETVLDGLKQPQGIVVVGSLLYIVDAGAKELIEYGLAGGVRRTIASNLPIGAPPGVTPKFLKAIGTLSGPMGPFAGIAAGADGTLYFSADAEGSVMALRPA